MYNCLLKPFCVSYFQSSKNFNTHFEEFIYFYNFFKWIYIWRENTDVRELYGSNLFLKLFKIIVKHTKRAVNLLISKSVIWALILKGAKKLC